MATLPLKSSHNELFVFYGQKDLLQMRLTLRCVQCMVTSVLRDQQYTFGVRGLLVTEKALLIKNDLAGILRRPMSYGPTGACLFQTLYGTEVFHEIQCTESSTIVLSFLSFLCCLSLERCGGKMDRVILESAD